MSDNDYQDDEGWEAAFTDYRNPKPASRKPSDPETPSPKSTSPKRPPLDSSRGRRVPREPRSNGKPPGKSSNNNTTWGPNKFSASNRPFQSKSSRQAPTYSSFSSTATPLAKAIPKPRFAQGTDGVDQLEGATSGLPLTNHRAERRRSKHPAVAPQVVLEGSISDNPTVAVIGGGISGVMCALGLAERGIKSTLFDTGKRSLGGRMASRHLSLPDGRQLAFDHAAQFFTASNPLFQSRVATWLAKGWVHQWEGPVGSLEAGRFQEDEVKGPGGERWVGTGGMGALCDRLAAESSLISVRRPVWMSHMAARNGRWRLSESGKREEEQYDVVVIAHNGKCANRLLAPAGVPLVASQMKRLKLSAIWALMAAFESPLPPPANGGLPPGAAQLEGAFVEGVPAVAWMAHNNAKLAGGGRGDGHQVAASDWSPLHCWTFLSTAAYGRANKVPQEAVPIARANRVKAEMMAGVATALGVTPGDLPPAVFQRVQLWGAALPLNAPKVDFVFDSLSRVGLCGDWLRGASVEAAALSGLAMADHIVKFRDAGGDGSEIFSVGLDAQIQALDCHDIGEFPIVQTEIMQGRHNVENSATELISG